MKIEMLTSNYFTSVSNTTFRSQSLPYWVFGKKKKSINELSTSLSFFSWKINRYCHHTLYQQDSSSNDIVISNCTHTVSSSILPVHWPNFFSNTGTCILVLYHIPWSCWCFLVSFSCLKIACMNIMFENQPVTYSFT